MTRIVLARHGEASYPSAGESGDAGGTLTELGRSQARALGDRLRDVGVAAVFCSELSRSRETAEIAAELLELPVQTRKGLQEYDIGDERGKPLDVELFARLLLAWLGGDLQVGFPGGEDGRQVAMRMFAVLDELVERFGGKTVLVVSHGGAIIATLGSIAPGETGLPPDGDGYPREEDLPGGASYLLEHGPDGWRLLLPRMTPSVSADPALLGSDTMPGVDGVSQADLVRKQEERRKLLIGQEPLVAHLEALLFRHDPIGINFGENTDEYHPEAETIAIRLPEAGDERELLHLVHEEFVRWFTASVAGSPERYTDIAHEIWVQQQRE